MERSCSSWEFWAKSEAESFRALTGGRSAVAAGRGGAAVRGGRGRAQRRGGARGSRGGARGGHTGTDTQPSGATRVPDDGQHSFRNSTARNFSTYVTELERYGWRCCTQATWPSDTSRCTMRLRCSPKSTAAARGVHGAQVAEQRSEGALARALDAERAAERAEYAVARAEEARPQPPRPTTTLKIVQTARIADRKRDISQ